ncbi:MAG TPA: PAS domain S-box protein [Patescibacteria group bacterium]|nr:PAS domain S-box protein [Patescibacteria group bacterium]
MEDKDTKKSPPKIFLDASGQEAEILEKQVTSLKWLHFTAAIGVPLAWIPLKIADPTAIDPLSLRLGLSLLSIIILIISLNKNINRIWILYLTYLWFIVEGAWILWIVYANDLSGNFITGLLVSVIALSIIYFRELWQLNMVMVTFTLAVIIMTFMVKDPKIAPIPFVSLTGLGIFVSYIVVRSRLITQRNLTDSWLFVSTIFEESQDCIMVSDFNTWENIYCNKATVTMFALKGKEDVIGKHGPEFIFGGVSLKNVEDAKKALAETGVYRREALYSRTDGSQFYSDTIVSVLFIGSKKYLLTRISDITKIKSAETVQQKTIEQIQRMNELMTGRELKMVELKKTIEELKKKIA